MVVGFPKSMNIGLAIDKKMGIESIVIGKGKSGKEETYTNSLNMVKGGFGGEYEIKEAQDKNKYLQLIEEELKKQGVENIEWK